MTTDTNIFGLSETNDSSILDRSDIRKISRVSIIGLSFHVFMGTCLVVTGLTWVELLAFSAEGYADLPRFRTFSIYAAIVGGIYLGNFLARRLGVSPHQLAVARVWLLFVFFSMVMFVGPYILGWRTHAASAAVFSSILTATLYSARWAYASLTWFGMLAAAGFLMNPTREPLIDLLASPVSATWGIAAALIIPFSIAATMAHVISRVLAAYEAHHLELLEGSEKLQELAMTDPLTGFYSRVALQQEFDRHLKVSATQQKKILVALIDVDNFKGINTFFGHSVGDNALTFIADHIQAAVPDASHLRLGGDEFLLIMTSDGEDADLALPLERIPDEVQFTFGEQSIPISVSVGYSFSETRDTALSQLIAEADLAMRSAKRQGKSLMLGYEKGESVPQVFVGPLPGGIDIALADQKSKSEIPAATVGAAILGGQIGFVLQPIMDARTGEITAAEALVRWQLADGSFVPLKDFLSTFITLEWQPPYYQSITNARFAILDDVRGIKDIDVHFNFSIETLQQSGDSARIAALGDTLRTDLQGFVVEISERDSGPAVAASLPHEDYVISAGGKFALDDFGKGLSNFDRLIQLKIDLVKFDCSLIQTVQHNPCQQVAIKHITALCKELGVDFIAEGVETVEQESTLLDLGVFAHQGFLRGKPMEKSEFFTLLRREPQIAKPQEGTDGQHSGGNRKVVVERSL